MTARKGEAIEPWLPPAQPCPADCRVTLQEHSTQLFHSAGKTCSAVCPGQALLPPKLCPHSWAGESGAVPVSHLPDPTSASTRTHSTFPSPVQLPNRALILPHVSRTCEVHKPQLSPHFSRLPPAAMVTKGSLQNLADQTGDTEEHQRCFSSNTLGQGCLSWAPSAARAALGSEWGVQRSTCQSSSLQTCSQPVQGVSSRKQMSFPSSTGQGRLCPSAQRECHTYSGGTSITFSRPREQRAFVSPVSVTRIRLSSIKTSVTPTTIPIDHF